VQRELTKAVDHSGEALVLVGEVPTVEPGRLVEVDGGSVAIGEARGVREQIADLDRSPRLLRREPGPRRSAFRRSHRHDRIPERGKVTLDRIVQQEAALLVEHQHGHARDRLAHRGDTEDRVGRHGFPRLDVHPPVRPEMRRLPVARDVHDRAGHPLLVDAPLHQGVQPGQPRRIETEPGGVRGRRRRRRRRSLRGN
jgi:hypothetical protein